MSQLTISKIIEEPFSALSLSEMLKILAALGWSTNYLAMVYRTQADKLPAIAVLPLCCDIAWEFTYAWIYPQASGHWQGVVRVWFFLHTAVLAATLRYAPNDWAGTPLGESRGRLVLLYAAVIAAFAAGQLCLALEMGGALGFHWGGALCQFLSSSAAVGQLLTRGHTRGASLLIWGARAISTAGGDRALIGCVVSGAVPIDQKA
ncbi:hypothetical protein AN9257.2 [Aspergillus nidulans FGSC A4]|uniref:Terpene cyclase ausL n=1 Tax=Emericella nidulans (strain FGSC A4 / ATCC 38163 / CBS 112.46 / NRRL 194 / M139) TaxID=227321 RepID=AUSL_EMENI|nr:protein ausL [Aspergillus nidulans FGSC A4]Q5AR23.1 RecName: Full=Terpene cyclase ausL; AltName: Full=Austinoid biosynthesis clusters protein L [Aspergillus nidulans FGSC A4]EAA66324.1 hypothetical protein AN9257.2 [Aspergillus nidulans FGSC A4]CBF87263.1 TPA: integral membrane protein (AFU_orthologue; AFUA_6G13950) [Aspergillus nidulans FGSC A4]|eukprot:XP_682526.1 hypothetical protein AN9257.2 [Aspergillus nidulans FGSC A4]